MSDIRLNLELSIVSKNRLSQKRAVTRRMKQVTYESQSSRNSKNRIIDGLSK